MDYEGLVRRCRDMGVPYMEGKCSMCPHKEDFPACNDCIADMFQRAADAIDGLIAKLNHADAQIVSLVNAAEERRWIPVTERLPETGVDVLVKFPQNMAVASIDIGEWVVNSGDGWCTDINLAGGEKNPTHWMPLPEPPKEEK